MPRVELSIELYLNQLKVTAKNLTNDVRHLCDPWAPSNKTSQSASTCEPTSATRRTLNSVSQSQRATMISRPRVVHQSLIWSNDSAAASNHGGLVANDTSRPTANGGELSRTFSAGETLTTGQKCSMAENPPVWMTLKHWNVYFLNRVKYLLSFKSQFQQKQCIFRS